MHATETNSSDTNDFTKNIKLGIKYAQYNQFS